MKQLLITAAIGLTAAGSMASAEKLKANIWFEPVHIMSKHAYIDWADKLRESSNGRFDFKVFTGGALVPPAASMQGVRDGIVDVGYHAGTYTPGELPITNILSYVAFGAEDAAAAALTITEMSFFNEAMQEEWANNGVIFAGANAGPVVYLMCKEKLTTHDQIKNKRIRMPGGVWATFAEALGATSVSVPSSEIYTNMERGLLACTGNDKTHLRSSSLWDVVNYVIELPMGVYSAGFTWAYNPDFWSGLTAEERGQLLQSNMEAFVTTQIAYANAVEEVSLIAREKGVEFVAPDQSLLNVREGFIANDYGGLRQIAKERFGVENMDPLIEEYRTTYAKWENLLTDIDRNNAAAFQTLVEQEIFSRIDAATYGVN
ncbi:TRAP-type C4-dicarboxylate transport system, substrate-binding protein [Roseovarius litoreus]|uniref:TRAP-type C4-dicarboxylate transport system, substrate-binding protein n=1 Tax=Roseovarius litoreus TaxID=1155722 RepID=A0A1M7LLV2_9RHOB|nr:C4-dicarboxylate TRAP transporter substrate-binding protein [Roseovarius litoreus]SHM79133.1 TRAP-type C4-dicarboxylate transport system, substrate-binding protein [Roseovarius litoreus]